jgi:hypothetical protein
MHWRETWSLSVTFVWYFMAFPLVVDHQVLFFPQHVSGMILHRQSLIGTLSKPHAKGLGDRLWACPH